MGIFPKNLGLSHTCTYGLLTPCKNSEKNNEPIPRKLPEGQRNRQMKGQKDGL